VIPDVLGGQGQAMVGTIPGAIQQLKAGKLRPLAVTSATRSVGLQALPTVGEFLRGYDDSAWTVICPPRRSRTEPIDKLNQALNAGAAPLPAVSRRLRGRLRRAERDRVPPWSHRTTDSCAPW